METGKLHGEVLLKGLSVRFEVLPMAYSLAEDFRNRSIEVVYSGRLEIPDLITSFLEVLKKSTLAGYNKVVFLTQYDTDLSQLDVQVMKLHMLPLLDLTRDIWPSGFRSCWVIPKEMNMAILEVWKVVREEVNPFPTGVFSTRDAAIAWLDSFKYESGPPVHQKNRPFRLFS